MSEFTIEPIIKIKKGAAFNQEPFLRTGQAPLNQKTNSFEDTIKEGYFITGSTRGPGKMVFAALEFAGNTIGVPLYLPPPHTPSDLAMLKNKALNIGLNAQKEGKIDIPQLMLDGTLDLDGYLKRAIYKASGYSDFEQDRKPHFQELFPTGKARYRYHFEKALPDTPSIHTANDHVGIHFFSEKEKEKEKDKTKSTLRGVEVPCLTVKCAVPGIADNKALQNMVSAILHDRLDWAKHANQHATVTDKAGMDEYVAAFLARIDETTEKGCHAFAIRRGGKDRIKIDISINGGGSTSYTCAIKGLDGQPDIADDIKERARLLLHERKQATTKAAHATQVENTRRAKPFERS